MTTQISWPAEVNRIRGVAPGEMRLVEKACGQPAEALDAVGQAQMTAFIALLRWYRKEYGGEELPDPAEIWEQAEWTVVNVVDGPELIAAPFSSAAAGSRT
jgi:hypothetical protein